MVGGGGSKVIRGEVVQGAVEYRAGEAIYVVAASVVDDELEVVEGDAAETGGAVAGDGGPVVVEGGAV